MAQHVHHRRHSIRSERPLQASKLFLHAVDGSGFFVGDALEGGLIGFF